MPRRTPLALLGLVVFSLALIAPYPTTLQAAPLNAGPAQLFAAAQRYHVAAGCDGWVHDPRLDASAQAHAQDIARRGRITHIGRDGTRVRDRIRRQGYAATYASESIARHGTADGAVRAWMSEGRSGPHRRNITGCQYTVAGVGVAYDSRGVPYWVMDYAGR
jgi:hypothetical protein